VQSIHEGNVRFEHCYRLDLELDTASGHRQACWSSWLSQYTYGQPRDRLDYARKRVRSFSTGDGAGRRLLVSGEGRDEKRQFYLVVPAPSSVHAPPPPIATRLHAVMTPPVVEDPAKLAKSSEQAAPGEVCASECRSAFSSCSKDCEPASQGGACASCDPDYRKCMQRCFE